MALVLVTHGDLRLPGALLGLELLGAELAGSRHNGGDGLVGVVGLVLRVGENPGPLVAGGIEDEPYVVACFHTFLGCDEGVVRPAQVGMGFRVGENDEG